MKNPKVGERIRIYFNAASSIPTIIDSIDGDKVWIMEYPKSSGECRPYDRRQCVRLVRKKRREWLICPRRCAEIEGHVAINGENIVAGSGTHDWIKVREIK